MRPRVLDAEAVRPMRKEVLRPGQSEAELAYPGDDAADTLHLALHDGAQIVAVVSMIGERHPHEPRPGDWRIRGMATRPEMRNRGLGTVLLQGCESHARRHRGGRIWCNARVAARTFYERGGFSVESDVYEIEGIGEHYLMAKLLRG